MHSEDLRHITPVIKVRRSGAVFHYRQLILLGTVLCVPVTVDVDAVPYDQVRETLSQKHKCQKFGVDPRLNLLCPSGCEELSPEPLARHFRIDHHIIHRLKHSLAGVWAFLCFHLQELQEIREVQRYRVILRVGGSGAVALLLCYDALVPLLVFSLVEHSLTGSLDPIRHSVMNEVQEATFVLKGADLGRQLVPEDDHRKRPVRRLSRYGSVCPFLPDRADVFQSVFGPVETPGVEVVPLFPILLWVSYILEHLVGRFYLDPCHIVREGFPGFGALKRIGVKLEKGVNPFDVGLVVAGLRLDDDTDIWVSGSVALCVDDRPDDSLQPIDLLGLRLLLPRGDRIQRLRIILSCEFLEGTVNLFYSG